MQSNVIAFPAIKRETPVSDEYSSWKNEDAAGFAACIASAKGERVNGCGQRIRTHTPSGAPIDAPVPQFAGLEHVEAKLRDSAKLYQYRHGARMLEKLCAVIVAEAHAAERA